MNLDLWDGRMVGFWNSWIDYGSRSGQTPPDLASVEFESSCLLLPTVLSFALFDGDVKHGRGRRARRYCNVKVIPTRT
jgi:hypothetical protein